MRDPRRRLIFWSLAMWGAWACAPLAARGQQIEYVRPVDSAPSEEDIGEGYQTPAVQRTPPRGIRWAKLQRLAALVGWPLDEPPPPAAWWALADVVLLAGALIAAAWIVLRLRRRRWLTLLSILSLLYFGFFREGCVCPIGATQNVALALYDPSYVVPLVVVVFFFLPLAAALVVGRAFCSGVCPLGAIQDLVVLKAVQVPRRLDKTLGLFKYVYLGLALWFVLQPAASREFLICRFDPFVGFFRRTGPAHMLLIGLGLLVVGMVIGRPYCRYVCPYGGLLAIVSRFAWRGVTITPDEELDCGQCVTACPFGAIDRMRAVRSSCLFCARCFPSCPREHAWREQRGGGAEGGGPQRAAGQPARSELVELGA